MANIDKHPAGSFCWIELATTDQNAAKKFYTSLFGWSVTDNPMGPGDFYSIFKLNGRDARRLLVVNRGATRAPFRAAL